MTLTLLLDSLAVIGTVVLLLVGSGAAAGSRQPATGHVVQLADRAQPFDSSARR